MFILLLWKAFSFNSCTSCYGGTALSLTWGRGVPPVPLTSSLVSKESFKNIILGLLFRWLHGCFLRTDIGEHGLAKTRGRKVRDSVLPESAVGRKSKDLFSSVIIICFHFVPLVYLPVQLLFLYTFFKSISEWALRAKKIEVLYQTQENSKFATRSHLWAHVFVLFLTCIWLMLWH